MWFFLIEHTKSISNRYSYLVQSVSKSLGIIENEKHSEDFIFHYERTNILLCGKAINVSFVEVIVGKILLNVRSFLTYTFHKMRYD